MSSTIQTLLANILHARKGRDVRDSIHDAIEQCYDDVSNPTLQTEALQAAVQAKIDAGEMAALTIGDGTITTAKIADGAITQAKLASDISFEADSALSTTSTNALQNKVITENFNAVNTSLGTLDDHIVEVANYTSYTKVTGKYFVADGTETDISSSTYYITSYMAVTPGETIYISSKAISPYCHYVFYDSEYAKIAYGRCGSATAIENAELTVPASASYIRIAAYGGGVVPVLKRIEGYKFIYKKWTGKKWTCMGDSITENNDKASTHYWGYISDNTGITFVNLGISATGFARTYNTNAYHERTSAIPTDSDVVTLFGSGNDMNSGKELGDATDTGTDTICGCINTTIDNVITLIPTVRLGIIAPTPWGTYPPSSDNAMSRYVTALETICRNRSIPYLDLYHSSGLRPWTSEGIAACYTHDGGGSVHPDETGHAIIAPRIKAFLETLLM